MVAAMKEKINYFTMAENDYLFLKEDYERGRYGNVMCYCSQNICEGYLKHIIDVYVHDVNITEILRTHNIKNLRRFLKNTLPDFVINWADVLLVDGYYFAARYPGSEATITDREDTEECWNAVVETRKAVLTYLETHPLKTDCELPKLNMFD